LSKGIRVGAIQEKIVKISAGFEENVGVYRVKMKVFNGGFEIQKKVGS
jgi:hypothetical protein